MGNNVRNFIFTLVLAFIIFIAVLILGLLEIFPPPTTSFFYFLALIAIAILFAIVLGLLTAERNSLGYVMFHHCGTLTLIGTVGILYFAILTLLMNPIFVIAIIFGLSVITFFFVLMMGGIWSYFHCSNVISVCERQR